MNMRIGVKFQDFGKVYDFDAGGFAIKLGDFVVVETEQGMSVGKTVRVSGPGAAGRLFGPDPADPDSPDWDAPVADHDEAGEADRVDVTRTDEHSASFFGPDAFFEDPFGTCSSLAVAGCPDGSLEEGQAREVADVPAGDLGKGGAAETGPGGEGMKSILRPAEAADLAAMEENETLRRDAYRHCRRCVRERDLDMKLVDVEAALDRSKLVFFFTAPGRIDFRELVKDLVKTWRTRIELRQIGVRHETQMVGAVGNCGLVTCCRQFLRKFAPVTIKMAKEQNLFLNPSKISGMCGRLLCCLSYEQENYEEFHRKCPKLGKRYATDEGVVRVLRANLFSQTVAVLTEAGEEKEFTLDEWDGLHPRRGEFPPEERSGAQSGPDKTGPDKTGACACGKTHPCSCSAERNPRGDGRRDPRQDRRPRPDRDRRPDREARPERDVRQDREPRAEQAGAEARPERRPDRDRRPERREEHRAQSLADRHETQTPLAPRSIETSTAGRTDGGESGTSSSAGATGAPHSPPAQGRDDEAKRRKRRRKPRRRPQEPGRTAQPSGSDD